MKIRRSAIAVTVITLLLALPASAVPLTYVDHFTGSNRPVNSSAGAQVTWLSQSNTLNESVIFLGRTNQTGSTTDNPFGLIQDEIFVSNFRNSGDPELLDITWDLTGTGYELAAVLLKDGGHGDTLWATSPGFGLSGSLQTIYWGTVPEFETGSISHVSFFGRVHTPPPVQTPDGGSMMMLLGFAFAALGYSRRLLRR